MTTEKIKSDLDKLEKTLFVHSLHSFEVEELEQMQEEIRRLKEAFLENSFVGYKVEELEETRFKLTEITYSIVISLKEQLHQNVTDDIAKLESLYRTA